MASSHWTQPRRENTDDDDISGLVGGLKDGSYRLGSCRNGGTWWVEESETRKIYQKRVKRMVSRSTAEKNEYD